MSDKCADSNLFDYLPIEKKRFYLELLVPSQCLWCLPAVLLPVPVGDVTTALDGLILPEQVEGGFVLAMLLPTVVIHEPQTRLTRLLVVDPVL